MSKHIVIVGGGFAGIKTARELAGDRRFQVTLISARENFEYHAALYRSATGKSHLEVSVPLADMLRKTNVELVIDTVEKIDGKKRNVKCASGESYGYDELVLALGTVTAYFGIRGLPEYSYGMKTIAEAIELKDHLHSELTSGHKPDLNYVVVGAGPTGIELAGELTSYLKRLRKNHKSKKPFRVDVVEAAPRILPVLPENYSRTVEKRLKQLGVKIYTNTAVKGETADSLQLPNGGIKSHTVVWTAGMTNHPLFGQHPDLFKLGKGGRVEVNDHLSAGNNIWVAGDSALTQWSGMAQTALYDGAYIARTLKRQLSGDEAPKYSPPVPIAAIPVGHRWCAVSYRGIQFYGYPGWLVRRWMDFELFRQLMPFGMALRTWLSGNRVEESCETCR